MTRGDGSEGGAPAADAVAFVPFNNVFNPAKGALRIEYVNAADDAVIKIYSRTGREIRSLEAGTSGRTDWDGRNGKGETVASGIYLVKLTSNKITVSTKIVVVK